MLLTLPSTLIMSKEETEIYANNHFNNLYFVSAEYLVCPTPPANSIEIALFAPVVESMDLWHHCFGHIGKGAVRALVHSVKGVTFPPNDCLSVCEPCIIGKMHRSSHPSSKEPSSNVLLDLVLGDICGPFPVMMPHGKLYFVGFVDSASKVLKIHLLALKSQAREAFWLTKASWERKTGKKVLKL